MTGAVSIDLEPFRLGSEADRRRVAAEIDRACTDVGFLRIVGHGVDDDLCRRMLDVSAEFFDRPIEEKRRYVVADRAANRGYAAEGTEALAYSLGETNSPPDLFEAFNSGREPADGPYFDAHRRFFAPNVWPDRPGEFRSVWAAYQRALEPLNDHLLRAFAMALDLEPDFFVARTRRAILTLRAINYERRAGGPDPAPGQMRMGAHTDYGVLTVLLADDVPGLQIRGDHGWVDVTIPGGSLIVNIGDMLASWTGDRWVSTLHRVVPPDGTGAVRRRSVAQFLEADPDVVLDPIGGPAGADDVEPMTAGDYLLAKLMGPRTLTPSTVTTDRDVT